MNSDGFAVAPSDNDDASAISHRAVQTAIDLDLIAPATADTTRANPVDGSTTVALIESGDRAWIARHAAGPRTPDGDWRAALAIHRAAPVLGERTVVPQLIGHSERHGVALTEAFGPTWLRLDRCDLRSPWSIEVFARVATSLARWHQGSHVLMGVEPATPWLLSVVGEEQLASAWLGVRANQLLTDMLGDRDLRAVVDTVARCWEVSHVVHGDLGLDNVMTHTNGSVRLIGWEAGGWGDPRWDLAGLLQELHTAEIQESINTSAHRAAVLGAYAERATSPSVLQEDDPTLRAFVAARLLLRALRLSARPDGDTPVVHAHLAAARALCR